VHFSASVGAKKAREREVSEPIHAEQGFSGGIGPKNLVLVKASESQRKPAKAG
jgi:hypothetical protein